MLLTEIINLHTVTLDYGYVNNKWGPLCSLFSVKLSLLGHSLPVQLLILCPATLTDLTVTLGSNLAYPHSYIHPPQFVVYSGYYYVLTVIFIGAGIYRLTRAGWIRSCLKCCHDPNPEQIEVDTHRDCPQPTLQPMQSTIQDNDSESIDSTNKLV